MTLDVAAIQALADDGNDLCKRTGVDQSYTVPDQQVLALIAELRAAWDAITERDEIIRRLKDGGS